MATDAGPNSSTSRALPAIGHPSLHGLQNKSKTPQSAPDSLRRHSLPLQLLPLSLWGANTSSASLVASEEAACGEHILDEATVAYRISALRQLNGAARSRHRYAKSMGARNSTFSQPVIVRTYSGAARPRSEQRDIATVKRENGFAAMAARKMELKMPPVEAFTFKGIMNEIRHGVAEDLERIAEICARSKYSLSNQYEVHMPPHGRGEAVLQTVGPGMASNPVVGGPTLQAIGSDDEQLRHVGRRSGRRSKSVAYGNLKTIMSSSRSSEEDSSKKKPATVIAEDVRARVEKKELLMAAAKEAAADNSAEAGKVPERPQKHGRSKSASFASMIIDNAQISKLNASTHFASPGSLLSEPARPQTSNATDLQYGPVFEPDQYKSSKLQVLKSPKPNVIQNESIASTLRPEGEGRSAFLGSIGSWLPWSKYVTTSNKVFQRRKGSESHAEGSLRDLLKITNSDQKGKSVERCE
ncbi:hypothetical protein QTJ16_006847 [Diplocarpon rosae]|uniref:Uncharacterized protein n=1 Tax=Diplocarpon rosae TaxID=946125 RepID=A0AAD9SU74_9HELO|nr:hypothetical protein QTJ16_006847 [Diplocarpon rosae]PBP26783.1 hypothetical protein BUE80_DR002303 [Diplocarpon rosae]